MRSGLHFGRHALYASALVAAMGLLAGGFALQPAIAQGGSLTVGPFVFVTCGSAAPCQTYKNTGTGIGLEGLTGKGTGLAGEATKAGTGVSGTSVDGIGVRGTSTSNLSGAFTGAGLASGGTTFGFSAAGPIGIQAEATSSSGDVLDAFGAGGLLFHGYDASNNTVFTLSNAGAVNASSYISGLRLNGCCTNTLGVFGEGTFAGVEGLAGADGSFGFYANGFGGDLFVGNNSVGTNSFVVDNSGNIIITGNIFTGGFCSSGCAQRPGDGGPRIVSYSPHQSQPSMEDFGEAQLSGGQAYVRLEATFAKTIDQHAGYMVFITPEGPNRGLYVTQKSATGFAVRENPGGASTIAFSYRIVAKPYGDTSARLPMIRPTMLSMAQKRYKPAPTLLGTHGAPVMQRIPQK